jgi:hypothetical protein
MVVVDFGQCGFCCISRRAVQSVNSVGVCMTGEQRRTRPVVAASAQQQPLPTVCFLCYVAA